jgi:hypothetical protein
MGKIIDERYATPDDPIYSTGWTVAHVAKLKPSSKRKPAARPAKAKPPTVAAATAKPPPQRRRQRVPA